MIVVMAQIGCYIPCERGVMVPVERVEGGKREGREERREWREWMRERKEESERGGGLEEVEEVWILRKSL